MLLGAALLAGCIGPPPRDSNRDEEMQRSQELLRPDVRPPVDATRKTDDDPTDPPLRDDVLQLSSDIPLLRIQADNRLNRAGADGLMAVSDFIGGSEGEPNQLIEALRFMLAADFTPLEGEQVSEVRAALARCLGHEHGKVRVQAARALQVHGPGAHRTEFLAAIADPERRVRWAVVRRYNDNPLELGWAQREMLIKMLFAQPRLEFTAADLDGSGSLTRREFTGTQDAFDRLDRDGDGEVSEEEWMSPVPSAVRADVVALLLRLHGRLTPGHRPPSYNPWLPAADQGPVVKSWEVWNLSVTDTASNANE